MNREQVKQVFDSYPFEAAYRLRDDAGIQSDQRLMLNTVCKRSELRPLLSGITFRIDYDLTEYFSIEGPGEIRVGPRLLTEPVPAAFHLRHALELSILMTHLSFDDQAEGFMLTAIAALHTAMVYLNDMISQEKQVVVKTLPEWMRQIFSELSVLDDVVGNEDAAIDSIRSHLIELYAFQRNIHPDLDFNRLGGNAISHYRERLKNLLRVSIPIERILTQYGDTRLSVDAATGLNQYGCSPRPRPWAITFSSCTASSVSDYAFWNAERLRQSLIPYAVNGALASRYHSGLENVREQLTEILQLDRIAGAEIVLSASGTDAELYALHLAIGASGRPLRNILISRTEVGSGTEYAAGGMHFDTLSPLGGRVVRGEPVTGFDIDSVEVTVLELRGDRGTLPSVDELDNQIREQVEAALADNKKVLIHLLDCSKTGIGGPSLSVVQELKSSYMDRVEVLVDAAQFRIGRPALHRYIESGFMVLVTASKFFTGPPFAGALIVPPEISAQIPCMPSLPVGLRSYAASADFPAKWSSLCRNLSDAQNLGLLLRWHAALWEISAFYSVDQQERFRTIKVFGEHILQMIGANSDLRLVMAPPHDRGYPESEFSWDQLPTIFTFLVLMNDPVSGRRRALTYDEARYAYRCVNMDIARFLPIRASDREQEIAAKRCHIGQPVKLHKENDVWVGALRIAAGARLVSGVRFDHSLGEQPSGRLNVEIQTAGLVFNKLSVIVKYWENLNRYELTSGANTAAGFYLF